MQSESGRAFRSWLALESRLAFCPSSSRQTRPGRQRRLIVIHSAWLYAFPSHSISLIKLPIPPLTSTMNSSPCCSVCLGSWKIPMPCGVFTVGVGQHASRRAEARESSSRR